MELLQKISNIKKAGRPANTEDVRSLLMACQFNAKFAFDNEVNMSYEDATASLRQLFKKDQRFRLGNEEENAYQLLMTVLDNPSILQPFFRNKPTYVVL